VIAEIKFVRDVLAGRLDVRGLAVAYEIAAHSNNGISRIGQRRIAQHTRIAVETVGSCIERIEVLGGFRVDRRNGARNAYIWPVTDPELSTTMRSRTARSDIHNRAGLTEKRAALSRARWGVNTLGNYSDAIHCDDKRCENGYIAIEYSPITGNPTTFTACPNHQRREAI
jgi:hypothetical protein